AASVCALEIAKQRAVAETEYRLQADVLEAALAGRFGTEAELAARAGALGYELQGHHVALVFALDAHRDSDAVRAGAGHPRPRLLDVLRRVLDAQQRAALVRQQDDLVAVFLPAGTNGTAPIDEAESLRRAATGALEGLPLSLGVGRPHLGIAGLSAGYH